MMRPSVRYPTLLDLAETSANGLGASLGPSTGDDAPEPAQPAGWQTGPRVGDDVVEISLGPSVGDDEFTISLGPSVGDDSSAPASDVRLKTDIQEVGTTAHGLPLYQFRYVGGADRYEGVMAQDVLKVMPEAVIRGSDGYYRVRYPMLGIEMRRA